MLQILKFVDSWKTKKIEYFENEWNTHLSNKENSLRENSVEGEE